MPAANGTPTIFEKIGALFNLDGSNNASVLAGDKADAEKAVNAVEALFGPVLKDAETEALGDLTTFLQGVFTLIPTITTVEQGVDVVKAVATAEAGPINAQVVKLGETVLTTYVGAALASVGKVNIPVA